MIITIAKHQLKLNILPDDIIAALSALVLTENIEQIVAIVLSELIGGDLWKN